MYEHEFSPSIYTNEEIDGISVLVTTYSDGSGRRYDYSDGTVSFVKCDGFTSTFHPGGDQSSFDPETNTCNIRTARQMEHESTAFEIALRDVLDFPESE